MRILVFCSWRILEQLAPYDFQSKPHLKKVGHDDYQPFQPLLLFMLLFFLFKLAEDAVQANQQASGFVERLVDKAAWNERSKRAVLKALFCAALL
ncbi:hypothetical protein COP00_23150 [Bacillus glycinifermentans]|uniref:Uncharacterized protein n=1 Tax=Bacillus glycinifermentans TaxID=1664069 RepID=A0A0T6BP98_9BACI|nr:hypothetical protein COP00_23150 [Bacillus glycinifermentans]KRT93306.1 hypothetical protein AB447_220395 [Bacillus glycinifermentans]